MECIKNYLKAGETASTRQAYAKKNSKYLEFVYRGKKYVAEIEIKYTYYYTHIKTTVLVDGKKRSIRVFKKLLKQGGNDARESN